MGSPGVSYRQTKAEMLTSRLASPDGLLTNQSKGEQRGSQDFRRSDVVQGPRGRLPPRSAPRLPAQRQDVRVPDEGILGELPGRRTGLPWIRTFSPYSGPARRALLC